MGVAEKIDAMLAAHNLREQGLFKETISEDERHLLTLKVSRAIVNLVEAADVLKEISNRFFSGRGTITEDEDEYLYHDASGAEAKVWLSAVSLLWGPESARWRLMIAAGRSESGDSRLQLCISLNKATSPKQLGEDFAHTTKKHRLDDEQFILSSLLTSQGELNKLKEVVGNDVALLVASFLVRADTGKK